MTEALMPQWRRNLVALVPMLMTLLLVLVAAVPGPTAGAYHPVPALALMSVYYWSLYRPDWLSAPVVFFLGLIADCLFGGPLGLNALLFLFAYGVTASQRLILQSRPFSICWLAFGMVVTAGTLLCWLVGSLFYGTFFTLLPFLAEGALTIVLFPLFARGFIWTEVQLARLV